MRTASIGSCGQRCGSRCTIAIHFMRLYLYVAVFDFIVIGLIRLHSTRKTNENKRKYSMRET